MPSEASRLCLVIGQSSCNHLILPSNWIDTFIIFLCFVISDNYFIYLSNMLRSMVPLIYTLVSICAIGRTIRASLIIIDSLISSSHQFSLALIKKNFSCMRAKSFNLVASIFFLSLGFDGANGLSNSEICRLNGQFDTIY